LQNNSGRDVSFFVTTIDDGEVYVLGTKLNSNGGVEEQVPVPMKYQRG
jgi:hypothetical protein